MFGLIEAHCESLVASIPAAHVRDYDWLVENLRRVGESEYQARFRKFWAMNAARLSPNYYTEYFRRLEAADGSLPALGSLAIDLYKVPAQTKGQHSLQFSFATKLLHMQDRHSPIYDSQVAAFHFFREPNRALDLRERVTQLRDFHGFLRREYARVLADGLLTRSITGFRVKFKPVHFTEEKVIDSLIWAFVSKLRNGGLQDGSVIYR